MIGYAFFLIYAIIDCSIVPALVCVTDKDIKGVGAGGVSIGVGIDGK